MTFYVKQNDTAPSIRATLKDGDDDAINLTGATARFHMRKISAAHAKVDSAATVVTASTGALCSMTGLLLTQTQLAHTKLSLR